MTTQQGVDSTSKPLHQPYTEPGDERYGTVAYEQTYKQGNKRYMCLVFCREDGAMTAVFRKYLRKQDKAGKRTAYKNYESIIAAASAGELKAAKFPDHPEVFKFLKSDFFKSL